MKTNGEPTKTGDGYIDHADACRAQHDAWKHDPADPANELRDWMQDCMSPQAVATIAFAVHAHLARGGTTGQTYGQVDWFQRALVASLGGQDAYERACREAGL